MSALPPKVDICSAFAHVRFGPTADIQGKKMLHDSNQSGARAFRIYRNSLLATGFASKADIRKHP
jgi:hypothetical protein